MGYLDNTCPNMVACVLTEGFREGLTGCVQLHFFKIRDFRGLVLCTFFVLH